MKLRTNLLNRITAALEVSGQSDRAFCLSAGVDHKVISQLRRGENVTLTTIEKIEAYITSLPQSEEA